MTAGGDACPTITAAVASAADPFESELLTAMAQAQATTLQAHEAYLAFSQGVFKSLSEAVQTQLDLVARTASGQPLNFLARGPITPALDRKSVV